MKKFVKRILSFAMAAAVLATAAVPAFADDLAIVDPGAGVETYKVEIFRPRDTDVKHPNNFKLGAFQLFSGTVPGDPAKDPFESKTDGDEWTENPGTQNTPLPLTDIKWGTAFGDLSKPDNQINLVNYIKALATADVNNFPGLSNVFKDLISGDNLADEFYADGKIKFDYLANAVAEKLASADMLKNRKLLQYFTDITAGYGNAGDSTQQGYLKQYYEGTDNFDADADNQEAILKGEKSVWTFDVPAGYYLIKDMTPHDGSFVQNSYSYSARMLFVAGNVTQTLKSSVPAVHKDIIRNTEGNSADSLKDSQVAGVGDEVKFILRGSLPSNFDKFVGYKYKFTDTLSDGLDFLYKTPDTASTANVNNSVTVSAHGAWYNNTTSNLSAAGWEWKADADISIPAKEGDTVGYEAKVEGKVLTVDFENLRNVVVQVKDTADSANTPDGYYRLGYNYNSISDDVDTSSSFGGPVDPNSSTIRVIYSATVNEKAVVNPAAGDDKNGNENTVFITYSNNPQNWDETDDTVTDIAEVYTLGLDIYKFDYAERLEENTAGEKLDGVNFAVLRKVADNPLTEPAKYHWQIARMSSENPSTKESSFKDKTYRSVTEWADLKDYSSGTSGTNVSDETTGEKLINLVKAYIQKNSGKVGPEDAARYFWEVTTSDGNAYLSGLDQEEEYTLVETKLPGGDGEYAQLMPFTVTLTATKDKDSGEYDGTVSKAVASNAYTDSMSMEEYVKVDGATYSQGIAKVDVVNFKYKDLPSTGGIGVYIYYIAGGFVLAAAVLLFILSRKKSTKKSA